MLKCQFFFSESLKRLLDYLKYQHIQTIIIYGRFVCCVFISCVIRDCATRTLHSLDDFFYIAVLSVFRFKSCCG
jgi:hypothetical protein